MTTVDSARAVSADGTRSADRFAVVLPDRRGRDTGGPFERPALWEPPLVVAGSASTDWVVPRPGAVTRIMPAVPTRRKNQDPPVL